ncbi:tyrosine-protein phosphatase non-receptor type 4-like [Halichondria panicea]|uniref:tyrosine-protein phosphatase non-receptor type 4-like n=1 Tax=Halichondria panicea TaxID=6063 RepID=UPI00312B52AD
MPFLKRSSSLNRQNTYQVSRRAEPDNAERPKGMIRCHVKLLDDTDFICDVDKQSHGDVLLDEVFKHLDLAERDYFGVAYKDSDVMKWVDPAKLLKKQFKGVHTMLVEFRVKFYMPDPGSLHEEVTRYQFYLQVKKDLYTTRLPCSFESACLLGSYIMQAQLGDYDPDKHAPGYVADFHLIPKQTHDMDDRISQLHQSLAGKTSAESEFMFLSYSKSLDFYGVELFPAKDHHGVDLGLGITGNGLSVFKSRILITTFSWLHVQKITYKRKRFYIELRSENGSRQPNTVGFHMDSYDGCKQLWKSCIEYNAFFRVSDVRAPPPARTYSFLRRPTFLRERMEPHPLNELRETALERSKSLRVFRQRDRLSKKSPQPAEFEDVQSSSVRRAQSLGRGETRRPVVVRRTQMSPSDDEDYEDIGFPGVAISNDLSGQFSLVPEPNTRISPNFTSNYRRMSNNDNAPTEYYDEQVAAEEEAGQVCMDDLMSEGLLLIRMLADSVGRYGFIFRGGVDENGPVMVTKVTEGSASSLCNPPLEEGDQILYINGKTVTEQTHDRLITMIATSREQSSRELVLIVKPRNLNRINPAPASLSESKLDDPGYMLRESLTILKESLVNGRSLLHYDRLYRRKPGMAAIASKLPHNLSKNRYRDISAYDETRVQLNEGPDYVNANKVDLEIYTTGQINHYIAAQGPMQHTCKDFWQMVWEQHSTLVVMLTGIVEEGKVRCCKYWPDLGCKQEYGKYGVTNLSEQTDRVIVTRQLKLKNRMSGEERNVVHMQYIDWPDHGIPGSKLDFLRFVQSMRTLRGQVKGPVVVHCSAGIGRTGVFILMETALCKIEVLEPIYPLDVVRIMRDQRGMLVQTPIQFQFVCESIVKAYEDDYVEIEIPSSREKKNSTHRSPMSYT